MKTGKLFSIGLVAAMIFAFSQQAFAQLAPIYGPGYQNLIDNLISNKIWSMSMENYTKQKSRGSSGVSRSNSSNQTSHAEVPAYRRYPAVQFKSTGTRLTVKEYAEAIDPVPEDREETRKMLSGILDKYEAEARAQGYPNDLALAIVSYIGLNSHIYHQRTEEPLLPFEQNIGLRDVLAEYAVDKGIFNHLPDQKKQEIYEILVMTAGLTYHFYEKAKRENNSEELKNCKLAAARNLEILGIKP
jgi:hypothetical protein